VRIESLQVQLSTAMQRLASLQRRAEHLTPESPRLIQQTLEQLEFAIQQLRAAQEELEARRGELVALRGELEAERRKYWEFFDAAPEAYLVTSPDGEIIEANRAAAELLNISQRFLIGKNFTVFVCTDRVRIHGQAKRLAETGGSADWVFSVRPRERAPFQVACRVLASESGDRTLRWMVRRLSNQTVPDSPEE
jgi:PAS domain S-box-containing protein